MTLGRKIKCTGDVVVSSSGARVFVDGLSGIWVPESVSGLMREWKWWMHSTTNHDHKKEREREEEEGGPPPLCC